MFVTTFLYKSVFAITRMSFIRKGGHVICLDHNEDIDGSRSNEEQNSTLVDDISADDCQQLEAEVEPEENNIVKRETLLEFKLKISKLAGATVEDPVENVIDFPSFQICMINLHDHLFNVFVYSGQVYKRINRDAR